MKLNKRLVVLTVALAAITATVAIPAINATAKNKDAVTLSDSNTVLLNQPVTGASVATWIGKVRELDAKGGSQPIYLVMNTPGGSISDGLMFIEALRSVKRPLKTVTIFSASMGFQIVQGTEGERLILKSGILMSHHAKGGLGEDLEFGGLEPSQTTSRYNSIVEMVKELDIQTVSRTKGKQTLESYRKQYDHEMWLTGASAVLDGYADKVVSVGCDKTLNGFTSMSTLVETPFGELPVSYDLSNCPLITAPQNIHLKLATNKGYMDEKVFLAAGGGFGASCLVGKDPNRLCALDTSLDLLKLNRVKQDFTNAFIRKQRQVVYY